MTGSRKIAIDFEGLKSNEASVLKSVCTISRQTARRYGFETVTDGAAAEILVLDCAGVAAPDALVRPSVRGVLWVGQEAPLSRPIPHQVVQRPLLASRLLSALDKLQETLATSPNNDNPAAQSVVAESPAFNPSVLVVDDSPTVRKQVELVLAGFDAQVVSVATGEGALEQVTQQHFDLVLLDVVLPGTDGYSVCRTIKRDPRIRHTPVIMLTSKSSPFDKIRGTLAGCESYLTKPVTKGNFERTVSRYLQAPIEANSGVSSLRPAAVVRIMPH